MELENPLITIIIPIYNREQTLERCLCSVLRQTYSHLEIIAVDDGSTDHSRVILDKYQKKDSRLRKAVESSSCAYFLFSFAIILWMLLSERKYLPESISVFMPFL